MPYWYISDFGGVNYARPDRDLIAAAFRVDDAGNYTQRRPLETADAKNVDFSVHGLKRRNGSVLVQNLNSLFATGETVLNAARHNGIDVVATSHSIYSNHSGSWAKLKISGGASDYGHANTPAAKCGMTAASRDDNTKYGLYMGFDNSNSVQWYKASSDELESPVSGLNGHYILADFRRLLYSSDGSQIIYETNSSTSNPVNFGYSPVRALTVFAPYFTNELQGVIYIFTDDGIEARTGFLTTDTVVPYAELSPIMNHRAFAKSFNWLVYLDTDNRLVGVNLATAYEFSSKIVSPDKDSPFDSYDMSNGFLHYSRARKQLYVCFGANSERCTVLDFNRGEPQVVRTYDEERATEAVRFLEWHGPAGWLRALWNVGGGNMRSASESGKICDFLQGVDDEGVEAVEMRWMTPLSDYGNIDVKKNFTTFSASVHIYGGTDGIFGGAPGSTPADGIFGGAPGSTPADGIFGGVPGSASVKKVVLETNDNVSTVSHSVRNPRPIAGDVASFYHLVDKSAHLFKFGIRTDEEVCDGIFGGVPGSTPADGIFGGAPGSTPADGIFGGAPGADKASNTALPIIKHLAVEYTLGARITTMM